jgi:hypothetical protein
MSMMHILCPGPFCVTKSILPDQVLTECQVHAACPYPCFMSNSKVYVYADTAFLCQCLFCMSFPMLYAHVLFHAACPWAHPCCLCASIMHVQVHDACPGLFCMSIDMIHVLVHAECQRPCTVHSAFPHLCCMSMSIACPYP